ncbi:MAG: YraN family protein [Propionibacteriaceae bacterium]|jgi:putative endonuclease|nr:YraN family protein [Propionibacteriaceae bacterium]
MTTRNQIGAAGEEVAARYVSQLGWEVVDRNWRSGRLGELDLVALAVDDEHTTVVFCEVKTRTGLGYGTPVEAVTRAKFLRLRRLAVAWLRDHPVSADRVRIDVIGVLLSASDEPQISHVEAAL